MSDLELASNLDERARYELCAWLWALRDHWPTRFRETLGERGERLLAALDACCSDTNRLLKQRRMALQSIARGEALTDSRSAV